MCISEMKTSALKKVKTFTLNGLDRYRINNELLHLEEAKFNDYFAKQRVKGVMPRGEFAEVCEQDIRADVLAFKEKIKDYSSPHSESVDFVVETAQGNIRLFGYMEPLFGDENQIIEWRFAKYKDSLSYSPMALLSHSTGDKRECTATTYYR